MLVGRAAAAAPGEGRGLLPDRLRVPLSEPGALACEVAEGICRPVSIVNAGVVRPELVENEGMLRAVAATR